MNNIRLAQVFSGLGLLVLGMLVFPIHTDQEFINLTASEGPGMLTPIANGSVYEQTFAVHGQVLSKIGTYLTPIQANAKTSNGIIRIAVLQRGEVKASGEIPVFRIHSDSATLIQITPPLPTSYGELITMQIGASEEATGLIALRKRTFDDTFTGTDVAFTIDGVKQVYVVAHKVFASLWPPIVMQAGGVFILVGMLLLAWNKTSQRKVLATMVALLGIVFLYAIPSFSTHPLFILPVSLLLIASWFLFRMSGRTILASIFGTCIFTCSTWLPLIIITGHFPENSLSIRDALLDPNQISISHGAGGYVGIPAALFAVAGVCIWMVAMIKKRFTAFQVDTAVAILFAISIFVTFVQTPLHMPRAIIVVVFCIAWFASLAFDKMQRFLGARDVFIQTLLGVLLAISLLDLMQITAKTFMYGLGL